MDKTAERDEHIALLTELLLRECRVYIGAHGSTQDTLYDVLKSIALVHVMLFNVPREKP